MNTEEKAKAYDEVLEQAKKELNTCGSKDCDAARQIFRFFPQLAESEDERALRIIRKRMCYDPVPISDEDRRIVENWLEKQKEPENISASTMIPSFHEELTEFELVLFNAVLDKNFVGAKGSENALAMTKKVAPELLAIAKKEPDWDREKCFVCQEYEKGFKQGHLEGCTAGYNKAMKEVDEQKEPNYTKHNTLFDECVKNCDPEVMKKVSDEIDKMLQKEQKPIVMHTPRYAPPEQKPAEWSEEDRLHYTNVLEALEYVKGCKSDYDKIEAVKSDIAWLKSLRSQAHWKPTEEQMKALLGAEGISRASGYPDNAKVLASLYEQLKQLM